MNYYELNVNYLNITQIFLTRFRYIELNVNINDVMNILVYLTEIKTKKVKEKKKNNCKIFVRHLVM